MVTVKWRGCRAPRLRPEVFQLCWEQQGQGGVGGGNHPEQPERKTPELDACLLHVCPALSSHPTLPLGEIPGETGQTSIAKFPMGCLGCDSEGMREILTPSLSTIPILLSAPFVVSDPCPYLLSSSPFLEPLDYHLGANLPLDLTLTNVPSTYL